MKNTYGPKKICVVGAGPKAAAIAGRAAVLRGFGVAVREIIVIERSNIGAAWSGSDGYSNGLLTLCSPAEKDIGFPYIETSGRSSHPPIAPEIFKRFSWSTFQVSDGTFAEWIDRGRNHPSHSVWADYLKWVFRESEQQVTSGDVKEISKNSAGQWRIFYETATSSAAVEVDGVVLTGTGDARRIPDDGVPDHMVDDPKTFWSQTQTYRALPEESKIVVIGDGGAAGAIVAWLTAALADKRPSIISVSSMGTLLPRGDGYAERRWFSDPSNWRELTEEHRRTILKHTEAGVISLRNKNVIDMATSVEYVLGRAQSVAYDDEELCVSVEYNGNSTWVVADRVVNAMGFDPWSQLGLVADEAAKSLLSSRKLQNEAERQMQPDLSFPPSHRLSGIHIPALCTLAQGPGMATLGSLGLVSKAILDVYAG